MKKTLNAYLQEIKNGANIFVSVNTKYGNSMIELKEKKEFKSC